MTERRQGGKVKVSWAAASAVLALVVALVAWSFGIGVLRGELATQSEMLSAIRDDQVRTNGSLARSIDALADRVGETEQRLSCVETSLEWLTIELQDGWTLDIGPALP